MNKSSVIKCIIIVSIIVASLFANLYLKTDNRDNKNEMPNLNTSQANEISFISKTDTQFFYHFNNNNWEKMFIKGVNMGAGKPGAFPGELAVTYDEYYRWFEYISKMNTNSIRVYTTQRPQFYNALFEFNQSAEKDGRAPIYLFHGVWIDEEDVATIEDAYGEDNKILENFVADGENIIDILHGKCILPEKKGHAYGNYTIDVSEYVIGWILGIEWDPTFVIGTNDNNPERNIYNGKYLYTMGASPFEAFLCEVGDRLVDYETTNYNMQRPVALSNWVTTDPLIHPNEPYKNEDIVEVNVEHIKWHETFKPGMFASYHVYPYYPDTFSYQTDYISFKDPDGKPNPYRAYLREISNYHTMPVLIAEFGIPASRGKAHENIHTGFNQGFIDEKTQGEMILKMMSDINSEGLAGGLIFAWQDEWFKRTWNNSDLDLPDKRPYWLNTQTNEQQFGLLTFDPGNEKSISYIDGKFDDWENDIPLYSEQGVKLYVKSDEAYVYLMADVENYSFNNDTLIIPVDTIDGQGNKTYPQYNVSFSKDADFIIKIHGENDSRVLVDAYYDNHYFKYAVQTNLLEPVQKHYSKNTGIFNPIRLCLTKKAVVPPNNLIIPFTGYETGVFKYGISNPESPEFNSLSDFYYSEGKVEMRIPWQILNVMDPSGKFVIDDMYSRGKISPLKINGFSFGIVCLKGRVSQETANLPMVEYSWTEWEQPTFHERLKPSYFVLQKGLVDLN